MATFVRDYHLTINQSVAIEAPSKEEAARIFSAMEHDERAWWYLRNEVYNHMMDYLGNNTRDVIYDVKPYMGVYQDENLAEDVIDTECYITKE